MVRKSFLTPHFYPYVKEMRLGIILCKISHIQHDKMRQMSIFDVLWRHMTSRRLMVSKTCKMEFENMAMSDIKFELHRISRKEMANEWKQVLKTALWRHSDVTMTSWWLFWVFPMIFDIFDFSMHFGPKITIFVDFMEGGNTM